MIKISVRIGGSCIGRYSRVIAGTTCAEIRILHNNEHKYAWSDIEFCIANNIYLIVNIDSYLTGGRWKPTNQVLRDFIIATKIRLISLGANKINCRFTADNESDEYESFSDYMNWVRVIHDALNGEFDLGAGNFGTNRKDWYENLALLYSTDCYEVFDFHMQNGLDDINDITLFSNWILFLKNKYQFKRLAVTEGNNFYNVASQSGHNLLKFQISEAERIGCEDFCFPYTNWMHNSEEGDNNMAYNWNYNPVSQYWNDMLNFIKTKKPIEDEDMKLEKIYKQGSKGIGVRFIQMVVNEYMGFNLVVDGIWGTKTEEGVKAFQIANALVMDGIVGTATFPKMIEAYPKIWDKINYMWAIGVR